MVVFTATALALMGMTSLAIGVGSGALATTALAAPTYVGAPENGYTPGAGAPHAPPSDVDKITEAATVLGLLYVGAEVLKKV